MFHKMGRTGIPACSHCRDSHPTRIASFFFSSFFLFLLLMSRLGGGHPSAIHYDLVFLLFSSPSFYITSVIRACLGNGHTIGQVGRSEPTHDLFQVFSKDGSPVVGRRLKWVFFVFCFVFGSRGCACSRQLCTGMKSRTCQKRQALAMHVECGSASSAHGVALYQTHTEDGLNIKPGDRLEHTRTHADDAVVPSGPSYRHTDTHTHTHRDYRSSLETFLAGTRFPRRDLTDTRSPSARAELSWTCCCNQWCEI